MDTTSTETLKALATEVETVAADADAAHEAETVAAGAHLAAALALVGPAAIRAAGTRPMIRRSKHLCDAGRCDHDAEVERYEERAICLSDDEAGPGQRRTSGTGGVYTGRDLLALPDGRLLDLSYSGGWSQWVNSTSEWTAHQVIHADATAAVRAGWDDVERYIGRLAEALRSYAAGTATKRTVQARARAQKLAAATTLLDK